LKFNQTFEKSGSRIMQANGIVQGRRVMQQSHIARQEAPLLPLLARFGGKFMLDIMPAALASVIGGFLFTQYQSGHAVTRTATEQVTPASAEMMAMVRDEHAMMMDYLKSQMVAEKNRAAAEDAEADAARGAADAKAAEDKVAEDAKIADANSVSEAPVRHAAALTVPKALAVVRTKTPVVLAAASRAPLVIAQADEDDGAAPAVEIGRAPVSLLAKTFNTTLNTTLDFKDHVVAATRSVVGAIGDAIGSVGERIGGTRNNAQQFSSAS
jgi:hypothetical protein